MKGSGLSKDQIRVDSLWPFDPGYLAVAFFAVVLGIPSLLYPFGFDQSNQAFIATRLMEGDTLFSDVACLKPPLPIYFHLLSLKLFGRDMASVRLLDMAWTALICLSLHRFCLAAFGERGRWMGILSGLFYAHFYYTHRFWHSAQTDGWLNLPVVLAMALVVSTLENKDEKGDKGVFAKWLLIGLLSDCALLFKYSAAGFPAFFLMAALLYLFKGGAGGRYALGGLLTGLAAGGAVFVLWLWSTGGLAGFVGGHLSDVLAYGTKSIQSGVAPKDSGSPMSLIKRLFTFSQGYDRLKGSPGSFLFGAGGAVFALFSVVSFSKRRAQWILVFIWFLAAWFSTAVQARWFPYHYLPVLAPWAIFAAYFIYTLFRITGIFIDSLPLRFFPIALLTVYAMFSMPLFPSHGYISPSVQLMMLEGYLFEGNTRLSLWKSGAFEVSRNFSVKETIAVADYLNANSSPDDSMFVWGSDMAIYFLVPRPRVTKIDSSFQASGLVVSPPCAAPGSLRTDFEKNPPELFILQEGDQIPHILGNKMDSKAMFLENKEIFSFISDRYTEEAKVERFTIYRLRKNPLPQSVGKTGERAISGGLKG
ncbi:hypothetical protein EPN95_04790 [Patescibacteria group bacterium]|nr:MAG: hypothetical protein EPN95_04790 [Patescibacteria group bacterium]